jgi:hypothetical protein
VAFGWLPAVRCTTPQSTTTESVSRRSATAGRARACSRQGLPTHDHRLERSGRASPRKLQARGRAGRPSPKMVKSRTNSDNAPTEARGKYRTLREKHSPASLWPTRAEAGRGETQGGFERPGQIGNVVTPCVPHLCCAEREGAMETPVGRLAYGVVGSMLRRAVAAPDKRPASAGPCAPLLVVPGGSAHALFSTSTNRADDSWAGTQKRQQTCLLSVGSDTIAGRAVPPVPPFAGWARRHACPSARADAGRDLAVFGFRMSEVLSPKTAHLRTWRVRAHERQLSHRASPVFSPTIGRYARVRYHLLRIRRGCD